MITEEPIRQKIETSIYIGQGDGEFEVVSYVVRFIREHKNDCPQAEMLNIFYCNFIIFYKATISTNNT